MPDAGEVDACAGMTASIRIGGAAATAATDAQAARRQSFASAAGGPGGIDGVRGSGHTCTRWARGDMPKNSR